MLAQTLAHATVQLSVDHFALLWHLQSFHRPPQRMHTHAYTCIHNTCTHTCSSTICRCSDTSRPASSVQTNRTPKHTYTHACTSTHPHVHAYLFVNHPALLCHLQGSLQWVGLAALHEVHQPRWAVVRVQVHAQLRVLASSRGVHLDKHKHPPTHTRGKCVKLKSGEQIRCRHSCLSSQQQRDRSTRKSCAARDSWK
jgi:hypothetical protein